MEGEIVSGSYNGMVLQRLTEVLISLLRDARDLMQRAVCCRGISPGLVVEAMGDRPRPMTHPEHDGSKGLQHGGPQNAQSQDSHTPWLGQ